MKFQCTQDEKWGDWRPHLAMIISNPSQKPELDRKAIITLGDTLHNRGDLFAAQFCYLMAKIEFSRYADVKQDSSVIVNNAANAVRLILLGASCHKNFCDFATDEAIIMTEIYEYACTLSNENFSIIEFQPYKFVLGTRMLDYGFHLKSLMYMEQISAHIQRNPTRYERSFIERVYNLAERLKFYDPVQEKTIDAMIDDDSGALASPIGHQQWQNDLLTLLGQFPAEYVPENVQQPSYDQNNIDKEFVQLNKQFSDLNMQYQQSAPQSMDYNNMGYNQQPDTQPVESYGNTEGQNDPYQQTNNQYEDNLAQQSYYQPDLYQTNSNEMNYGADPNQFQLQSADDQYVNNYIQTEVILFRK